MDHLHGRSEDSPEDRRIGTADPHGSPGEPAVTERTPANTDTRMTPLKQVQALTPAEHQALVVGLRAVETALDSLRWTAERWERTTALRGLRVDKVVARDENTDLAGDVTLAPLTAAEHALLLVAADAQRADMERLGAVLVDGDRDQQRAVADAHSALVKVATAREVSPSEDDRPSLDALLTAARTLNTSGPWEGPEGLRLWFTVAEDGSASGGQGYDGSHEGHAALLAQAARVLHRGFEASTALAQDANGNVTLVGHFTPESLACDCGKGLWCPLVRQERVEPL